MEIAIYSVLGLIVVAALVKMLRPARPDPWRDGRGLPVEIEGDGGDTQVRYVPVARWRVGEWTLTVGDRRHERVHRGRNGVWYEALVVSGYARVRRRLAVPEWRLEAGPEVARRLLAGLDRLTDDDAIQPLGLQASMAMDLAEAAAARLVFGLLALERGEAAAEAWAADPEAPLSGARAALSP